MHTTAELRQAFIRSQLLLMGWSFDKAIECHAIRICLEHIADANQSGIKHQEARLPYSDK